MRIFSTSTSFLAFFLFSFLLTGCTWQDAPNTAVKSASTECEELPDDKISELVTVEGEFLEEPKISFSVPLHVPSLERRLITTGDGQKVQKNDSLRVAVMLVSGKKTDANGTPEILGTPAGFYPNGSSTTFQRIQVDDKRFIPGLIRAVECVPLGSRVLLAGPTEEVFGSQNFSNYDLTKNDTVVLLVDVAEKVDNRAIGERQPAPKGFPLVEVNDIGEPMITIPEHDPPTETQIAVLIEGEGDTVYPETDVTLQYKGVLWRTGKPFDSTWARGAAPVTFSTSQVVEGFRKAIQGQKVGSQVLVIIPPEDGYGEKGSGEITATDTMVFVIDILDVKWSQ